MGARMETKIGMCGLISPAGPSGEPLACAYSDGHEGVCSWATLPTFVQGEDGVIVVGGALSPVMYSPEVTELIQGAIESTDDTPRTARLRAALVPFGVE